MRSSVLALVVLAVSALPVAAQDTRTADVTPYLGIGSAGASPLGIAVTFPLTSTLALEMDTAYRNGEGIRAFSTSGSLLYSLPRVGQATPYLAGGIGLSQYGSPVFSSEGRPIGSQSRLALTVNTGGGVRLPLNRTMSLRTDARYYKSFGNQGSEAFRVAQGISFRMHKR
jgi:hypothetical protein